MSNKQEIQTKSGNIGWRCTNKKCNWQFREPLKYCTRCGNEVKPFDPLNDAPPMP
jgi:rRNA maturation endonuclease Nob1